MRFVLALVAVFGILLGMSAMPVPGMSGDNGSVVYAAAQQPSTPGDLKVDINVNKGGGTRAFWASPVWIAIGVIAVVLLIVIVAMIARGGGTTVVRG